MRISRKKEGEVEGDEKEDVEDEDKQKEQRGK
jgi:hypothetical protein